MAIENPNWIVSQIGSREHYACPVGFQRRGRLRCMYTDIWSRVPPSLVERLPGALGRLSRRTHPELPNNKVISFSLAGMSWERTKGQRLRNAETTGNYNAEHGKWFATNVRNHLARQQLTAGKDALFLFSTGALETLTLARDRGIFTMLDQLDPGKVDEVMVLEESERWPDWEERPGRAPQLFFDRLAAEWDASDVIVVNSEFSKRSIMAQGVAASKIFVLPLAYEPEAQLQEPRKPRPEKPVDILWLGQIVLRKGIPYLFEAARKLQNYPVHFHIAGRVGISQAAVATAPANVTIHGKVPRDEALRLYASCDAFILPTISDGFAITQLEAMSLGLPVITTPNCGDVVTEGVDGYIVPIRDPDAIVERIVRLVEDRTLLAEMSAKALEKSKLFTLDRYTDTIEAVYRTVAQSAK